MADPILDRVLQIRVTQAELAKLQTEAAKTGATVSGFVRAMIQRKIGSRHRKQVESGHG